MLEAVEESSVEEKVRRAYFVIENIKTMKIIKRKNVEKEKKSNRMKRQRHAKSRGGYICII